jgi:hypothetical protein
MAHLPQVVEEALCRRHVEAGEPNYWLSSKPGDAEEAQGICRVCPARLECALYRLEIEPSCGVWGGMIIGGYAPDDICVNPACRKEFMPTSRGGAGVKLACSRECWEEYRSRFCQNEACGKKFVPHETKANQKFCSLKCAGKSRSEDARQRHQAELSGVG